VEITSEGGPFSDVSSRILKARAEKMLSLLGLPGAEVSIALVDDKAMKGLHARFMNDPSTTDVLSFPLHHAPREVVAKDRRAALGDIAICVPQARRQARARKATPVDEATALLAHGILHLLGFDHRTKDEEREMFALGRVLEVAGLNKRPIKARLEVIS
jgi:probable rRNA maturation factor